MQHLQSLTKKKYISDIFVFLFKFYLKIIIEFIMNLSSEYQGICNLEYVILLLTIVL